MPLGAVRSEAFRRAGWCAAGIVLLAALVSGCSNRPDTRYLESRELAPLRIPEGLDAPVTNDAMAIPAPAADAAAGEWPADIEIPPRRIGGS